MKMTPGLTKHEAPIPNDSPHFCFVLFTEKIHQDPVGAILMKSGIKLCKPSADRGNHLIVRISAANS